MQWTHPRFVTNKCSVATKGENWCEENDEMNVGLFVNELAFGQSRVGPFFFPRSGLYYASSHGQSESEES